jgi:hypothetical protein
VAFQADVVSGHRLQAHVHGDLPANLMYNMYGEYDAVAERRREFERRKLGLQPMVIIHKDRKYRQSWAMDPLLVNFLSGMSTSSEVHAVRGLSG